MSSFTPLTDAATSSVVSSNTAAAMASTGARSASSHSDGRRIIASPSEPVDLSNHQACDLTCLVQSPRWSLDLSNHHACHLMTSRVKSNHQACDLMTK